MAGRNVKTVGNIGNPILSFRKSKKKYFYFRGFLLSIAIF